jgi:hypothetical protein
LGRGKAGKISEMHSETVKGRHSDLLLNYSIPEN